MSSIVLLFPLLSIIFALLSAVACLRFFFSRNFYFWIFPLLFSSILTILDIGYIFFPTFLFLTPTPQLNLLLFLLSFFWYLIIIFFRYFLKKAIGENRYKSDSYKNLKEAQYLEKLERRAYRKYSKSIHDKEVHSGKSLINTKETEDWLDLFDNF